MRFGCTVTVWMRGRRKGYRHQAVERPRKVVWLRQRGVFFCLLPPHFPIISISSLIFPPYYVETLEFFLTSLYTPLLWPNLINSILSYFIVHSRHWTNRSAERERERETMILTTLDCFTASGVLSLSSTCSSFRDKSMRFCGGFNRNLEKMMTTRIFQRCKASLITNPESFQVGRLIGSYGFMNITRPWFGSNILQCCLYYVLNTIFAIYLLNQKVEMLLKPKGVEDYSFPNICAICAWLHFNFLE